MESRHLAVMMTDIQGFTRATSGMGREQVEELLAMHEDLLVPVIKEFGGTIVKGLGDAFLVTFESPTRGVQAGVRIQEVLAAHNAEANTEKQLRVRVALNAGEVNIRDGDVFGEAVNITARVEGVCAAEQVTLTEAVFLLLEKEAVETEYIEDVELKGIPFPVKLYRVVPAWLPPEDRDVARARSKAGPKGGAVPGAAGPGRGVALGALGLAALVGLGVWLAQPAAADVVLDEHTRTGSWDDGWKVLDLGLRDHPTPALREAAGRFGRARLAELRQQGKWPEAFAVQGRLAERIPGVEGLTRPQDRVALAKEGLAALRGAARWPEAEALREALLQVDRLEGDEDLRRWAREDLVRVWDARCPPGQPAPEDLERRIAAPEVTAAVERLGARDHEDPFLAMVRAVRSAFRDNPTKFEELLRKFAEAVVREPALGERQELGAALRILCETHKEATHDERAWTWAEPLVQRKFGAWVDPLLEAWVRAPAPRGTDPGALLAHLRLRRNARRLAARRGNLVVPDAGPEALADARTLAAGPAGWSHDRTMAELQDLALRVGTLPPADRPKVEGVLRELVRKQLDDDDATPSTREAYSKVAEGLGFTDLVDPHRELVRDMDWILGQVGDYNFRPNDWIEGFTKGRLARVEPGMPAPWRESLATLMAEWSETVQKKFPAVSPAFEEARQKLATP